MFNLGNKITVKQMLRKVYPVGSIYTSVNSTSPATLFGGTWEQIQDRFLLAAGTTYSAGITGGEATHKLTVDEMPSHSHRIENHQADSSDVNSLRAGWASTSTTRNGYQYETRGSTSSEKMWAWPDQPVGGSQAHNNMPPYLTVYVWKRTA